MKLSAPTRAAIVTFGAWLFLVIFTQFLRDGPMTPPKMTAFGFWGMMAFIGVLLGLLVSVLVALLTFMASGGKK